jgi:PAS domain S-box-containing protein
MHLLRAHHCFYYSESKGAALSHLARAESRSPSVDENFAIFFFRKATHESFSGGGGNSDILQYIQMQKTMADAKKYDEQAVRHTLSFWDILLTSQPDLNRMNDLAELINSSMLSAMSAFKLMMRLSGGNSIAVLRMYAGFLLDVANEPTYGHELLVRAEELEDLQSKEHSEGTQENANGVPSLDDRHAIVSISGEMKKLGTIFQVNATALRLLGYNKYEMINRNVTLIVPAPFAQHHHNYLRRYMDLGDASVLNKTRALFAMHKTGYLVPINLYVREVSGESEHAFLGVLKEQVSQIQSAIVDPNYNIFGCTVVLGNLFNSSVEEMRAGSYHLSRWFPSFLQNLPDMKSPRYFDFL